MLTVRSISRRHSGTRARRTTLREMHATRIPGADEAAVRGLIARGEPGGVERKAAIRKGDGLCPRVLAFANTHGGWILLGVNDAGAIVGWRPRRRLPATASRSIRRAVPS